jgi:hypothetical protein
VPKGIRLSSLYSSGWPERLAIVHVCRAWRRVALEHPRVWRYISLEFRRPILEIMLTHAKAAPLVMSHRGYRPLRWLNRFLISAHLSHTEEIDLSDVSVSIQDTFSSFSTALAPLLRTLQLRRLALPDPDSPDVVLNLFLAVLLRCSERSVSGISGHTGHPSPSRI